MELELRWESRGVQCFFSFYPFKLPLRLCRAPGTHSLKKIPKRWQLSNASQYLVYIFCEVTSLFFASFVSFHFDEKKCFCMCCHLMLIAKFLLVSNQRRLEKKHERLNETKFTSSNGRERRRKRKNDNKWKASWFLICDLCESTIYLSVATEFVFFFAVQHRLYYSLYWCSWIKIHTATVWGVFSFSFSSSSSSFYSPRIFNFHLISSFSFSLSLFSLAILLLLLLLLMFFQLKCFLIYFLFNFFFLFFLVKIRSLKASVFFSRILFVIP